MYTRSNLEESLRQGEILTGLIQLRVRFSSIDQSDPVLDTIIHPYAVVITEDCDLAQDYAARSKDNLLSDKILPAILFCEATTAVALKDRESIDARIWNRAKINKDERYHFLQLVE